MVYSFTNNKKSSYTFLGMLLLSVFAFEASCYGARNKQSCTKETASYWTDAIGCFLCKKQNDDTSIKLQCCKMAVCKKHTVKMLDKHLLDTLFMKEPLDLREVVSQVKCPNQNCSVDDHGYPISCLEHKDFLKLIRENENLLYTYQAIIQASPVRMTLNCPFAKYTGRCNNCGESAKLFAFSNCHHVFCLGCFEQRYFSVRPAELSEMIEKETLSYNDFNYLLNATGSLFSTTYSKEGALFGCPLTECRGGLASREEISYLEAQSKTLLELKKNIINKLLNFVANSHHEILMDESDRELFVFMVKIELESSLEFCNDQLKKLE